MNLSRFRRVKSHLCPGDVSWQRSRASLRCRVRQLARLLSEGGVICPCCEQGSHACLDFPFPRCLRQCGKNTPELSHVTIETGVSCMRLLTGTWPTDPLFLGCNRDSSHSTLALLYDCTIGLCTPLRIFCVADFVSPVLRKKVRGEAKQKLHIIVPSLRVFLISRT